ncbi:MAG: phosphoribosylformylglycinamidine synthase subunit PurS [Rhodospirillaceae bacterium]|nr:phosphoribosylformylglycinamidine synthase subunit PurS [Rhodospirillaceae bacterium]MCY4066799.1 phosphoribosylformylglycinamidine synthase subunit PurS [Rhodospirillaceae bacterium]MDE0703626.1 phosphoribosylformylglycinamidine synthase subunit PurS [Rhodospirillaceae bacterium]MXW90877.1 phosphoribosylformylglycinamidine synthase subunit PurS [Rhodospirillaceae bacterium]MYB14595.1 phosphoribosylformylglycinamidine synthase subunit PurS [Rhodospirillaceae bacterium]
MRARVHVTLKPGVLDPQGKAIAHALEALGFDGVADVRQGKYIEIDLEDGGSGEGNAGAAEARVSEMCEKLLANTVIENYRVEIDS